MITPRKLNWFVFVVGMIGVWETTHNWYALLWAFVASIHFTGVVRVKEKEEK